MEVAALIVFDHVGKSFDGGRVKAVDDVSLEVANSEFLAIVGTSGSGKTTLLRLANRLIEADQGRVTIEGEDVRAADPVALRRRIGTVFQSGGLFPHMSVAANIGITPKLKGERDTDIAELQRLQHAGVMSAFGTIVARAKERGELSSDQDPTEIIAAIVSRMWCFAFSVISPGSGLLAASLI